MPKVTEEYRSTRRGEIAAAALRAFKRKGFQGTSMADIIAESGLSAGAIYGHFSSKSDIVVDVATRVIGARVDDVGRLMARDPLPPPSELLRALTRGMLAEVGDPTILVQVWGEAVTDPALRALASGVFGRLRAVLAAYLALWNQREHKLDEAAAHAVGEEQVALFVAAAQGFILQSALMPDFDGDQYLTTLDKYLPR